MDLPATCLQLHALCGPFEHVLACISGDLVPAWDDHQSTPQ
jgi:hypothetical protein